MLSRLNKTWVNNMAHHEMIDGVMKELMRGIKIAAEPINHHNGAHNDMGAISNNGRRMCV